MWVINFDGVPLSLCLQCPLCRFEVRLTMEPPLSSPQKLRGQLEQHWSSHTESTQRYGKIAVISPSSS